MVARVSMTDGIAFKSMPTSCREQFTLLRCDQCTHERCRQTRSSCKLSMRSMQLEQSWQ